MPRLSRQFAALQKEVSRDIEQSAVFRNVIDSTSDGFVLASPAGEILYVNAAWQRITGYSADEAIGKNPRMLKSGKTNPRLYEELWDAITHGRHFYTEDIINRRKDGSEYYSSLNVYPVLGKENAVRLLVASERDITARKKQELAQADFISLASHQLRNPLTALRWIVEMLQSEKMGTVSAEQKDLLNDAEKLCLQTTQLTAVLLSLARLQAGTMSVTPKPIPLREFFAQVACDLAPFAQSRGVHITVTCPERFTIESDQKLLKEAFGNIVHNAVKYNSKNGSVTVHVVSEHDGVQITVTDTGIGIPERELAHVFDRFFRGQNTQRTNTEGNGLGMYLAHSVITLLGGSISVQSEEGRGTTFTIRLPLHPPSVNAEAHPHH